MKTAEEILDKHISRVALLDQITEWHKSFIIKAMEEYASQSPSTAKRELSELSLADLIALRGYLLDWDEHAEAKAVTRELSVRIKQIDLISINFKTTQG